VITLFTGSPGHGKSYGMVRLIDESVSRGIPVATNVALKPEWAQVMARHHTFFARFREDVVAAKAERYEDYVYWTPNFFDLLKVRFSGEKEGRGRVIFEEAHNELNTRAWDQHADMNRSEAIAARLAVVRYFSAHRHYGVDAWLVTQDEKNIDTQIRSLYEFHTETRNMRRLPFFGSIFRFNLFVVTTRWNDRARTKAGLNVYGLSKKLATLYDTHGLGKVDWPEDAVVLPRVREVASIDGAVTGARDERPGGPDERPRDANAA
jgi:hypothetical protein